jgi:acetyl-CoA carboxylase alpha subunit
LRRWDFQNHFIKMKQKIRDRQIIDYINLIFDTFMELHGDRKSGDDRAVIGGLARVDGYKVAVIVYQMDESSEPFRVPGPAGYRKCLRLVKLVEVFDKPVILFFDIPSVPPLPASEQQRVDEAIARNLEEMSQMMTPIIGIIMSEQSAVTAIEICVVDRVIMLEGVSPVESSASSADTAPARSKVKDLLDLDIVHRTLKVSSNGDLETDANALREVILEELSQLSQVCPQELAQRRLHRLQYEFLSSDVSRLASGSSDSTT